MYSCEKAASKVLELRHSRDLTQRRFSELIDVHLNTVKNIERSRQDLTMVQLCKIADVFSVSVDWLLGRTEKRLLSKPCVYDMQSLGQAVRLLRIEKDLSLERYSFLIGVCLGHLCHLEHARIGISVPLFFHMLEIHAVSADWLLGRSEKRW